MLSNRALALTHRRASAMLTPSVVHIVVTPRKEGMMAIHTLTPVTVVNAVARSNNAGKTPNPFRSRAVTR